jgi:hypothetical protein
MTPALRIIGSMARTIPPDGRTAGHVYRMNGSGLESRRFSSQHGRSTVSHLVANVVAHRLSERMLLEVTFG